ncbi:hypothetical protein BAMA_15525 [Bacillus manliponensis]|uniref:Uncharacterized protein n=1 Tax=Bacillus manliponensis TaxID=574376 RepID=A0A073JST2_9BACI|nr:hypothetical protein [Bacillus manliponensis]KEK17365.1 hypothetical protein BAMA_15525 [Bacillus manliponensis]
MTPLYKFQLSTIFEGWKCECILTADSEERAKQMYYQKFSEGQFEMPYQEFVKFIQCKYLEHVDITQVFSKEKLFQKMCEQRKIPFAYMGMRVEVTGRMGTIVGSWKKNLYVVFDGNPDKFNCNPWWEIAYFDEDGNVVRDYRKGAYTLGVM